MFARLPLLRRLKGVETYNLFAINIKMLYNLMYSVIDMQTKQTLPWGEYTVFFLSNLALQLNQDFSSWALVEMTKMKAFVPSKNI